MDKIEKVKKITQKLKPQQLPEGPANKDHFEALMKQRGGKVETATNENNLNESKKANSIMDEARIMNRRPEYGTRSSPGELVAQAEDVIAQIDTLKHKLETPNLEIKGSVQTILKSKLEHIDESLKIALQKAGGEYVPPEKPTGLMKPIDRFLGLLTHGQSQLETIAGDIKKISADNNGQLSPANMLLIQIKVHHVQQEIELFTSMLNKALESAKTVMNVQV